MMSCGSRHSVLVALVSLVSIGTAPMLGQARLSDRVLLGVGRDDMGFFASPHPSQERLRYLLTLMARSARIPIGFEEVAGDPVPYERSLSTIPSSERRVLIGLTVGEGLDALVSSDPRYSWREQDGVVLIRPVKAWEDPAHFLHQRFSGFRLSDSTVADVAEAIYAKLRVPIKFAEGGVLADPAGPDFGLQKRMDFDVPSGTLLDGLNSVVRAHGGLGWMVHYANAPADIKTSCVRFVTFDGKFSGVGAAECHAMARVEGGVPR